MPVPFLFDRGISFRGDLSYFDLQQKLSDDDIMIKDYLGIGEQSTFVLQQLELNVTQINKNEFDIDYNFQYLHGDADYSADFDSSSTYSIGNYVTVNNKVGNDVVSGNEYAAIVPITAGAFDASEWREVSTTSNYELINYNFDYLNGTTKPDVYVEATNYSLYETVTYIDQQYVCTTATTGAFNPAHWQLIGVAATGVRLEAFVDVSLAVFQFVAYGGLTLSSPPAALPNITGTYQTLDVFDAVSFATPRNVTQSVANSSLSFDELGVYELSASLAFSHNEDNAGRTIFIRSYNLTDAVAIGVPVPIFIARNQPGTNYSLSFPLEVNDSAILNKEIILQIGGGDTVSSVSFQAAEFYVKSMGEYRGTFT